MNIDEEKAYTLFKYVILGKKNQCPNCGTENVNINVKYKIYCNIERRGFTIKHNTFMGNSRISYFSYFKFITKYFDISLKRLESKSQQEQAEYIGISRQSFKKLLEKHKSDIVRYYTSGTTGDKIFDKCINAINKK